MDKEVKDLLDQVQQTNAERSKIFDKQAEEIKTQGRIAVETKAAIDQVAKDLNSQSERLEAKMRAYEQAVAVGNVQALAASETKDGKALRRIGEAFQKGLFRQDGSAMERKDYALEADNTYGGFLVPQEYGPLFQKVLLEFSVMRKLCSVISTNSPEWHAPNYQPGNYRSNVTWKNERNANPTPKLPVKFGQLTIMVNPVSAFAAATRDIINDSPENVAGIITGVAADDISKSEADNFIGSVPSLGDGNGDGKPSGFLNDATIIDNHIPSGASGAFLSPDSTHLDQAIKPFNKMVAGIKQDYLTGGVPCWVMTRTTYGQLLSVADMFGHSLIKPDFSSGVYAQLINGFPIEIDAHMPEMAANSYSIAFGNFKYGYQIVDHRMNSIDQLPLGYNQDPDSIYFYLRRRVGGAVRNPEAIRVMKFATA